MAWTQEDQLRRWFGDPIILIDQPDSLRDRVNDRAEGFAEDLKNALERMEAVPEQAACSWICRRSLGSSRACRCC